MMSFDYSFPAQLPFENLVIRSSLALMLACVACWLLWKESAAWRHRIWLLGLAATIVIPLSALSLPTWAITWPVARSTEVLLVDDGSVPEWKADEHFATRDEPDNSFESGEEANPMPTGEFPGGFTESQFRVRGARTILVSIWLLGFCVGISRLAIALGTQTFRLRTLETLENRAWLDAVADASRQLGLSRHVSTVVANSPSPPAVVGAMRPRLIVPPDWSRWSPQQRECILLHELAHVKRHDIAAQLVAIFATSLHWYHPLVWYAAQQLRRERELAADDCVLAAGHAPSTYAEQLLQTLRTYRGQQRIVSAVGMADTARLDKRIAGILDAHRRREPVHRNVAAALFCTALVASILLSVVTLSAVAQTSTPPSVKADDSVWKQNFTIRFPGALPVSVAISSDRNCVLVGDTNGDLMSLNLSGEQATYSWKANVGGDHAAVAYSPDETNVYATTRDGVVILDSQRGQEIARIAEQGIQPIVVGAFPYKGMDDSVVFHQIVMGHSGGYTVKTWPNDDVSKAGTIDTTTLQNDTPPSDTLAVPLAVDPNGRCAIMTGPIDATGNVAGRAGANVLWAYVCGDYSEGSPGNRVLKGHASTVVCAAWAKRVDRALTGDVQGCVIEWDAKTMTESTRREFPGRVAAVAVSVDGTRMAAYVVGEKARLFVWDAEDPEGGALVIHEETADFGSTTVFASLSFSADGKRLAGCVGDKRWLNRLGELTGRVRVWDCLPAPRLQPVPRRTFSQAIGKEGSQAFVVPLNHAIVVTASKATAIDLYDIRGRVLSRRVGMPPLGRLVLSADNEWLAREEIPTSRGPERSVNVVVSRNMAHLPQTTIRQCHRLLDISPRGDHVVVLRGEDVELHDAKDGTLMKNAGPFRRVTSAQFSSDGARLAIVHNDGLSLTLWNWATDKRESIGLDRQSASIAFSPDDRLLAEGPVGHADIRVRSLETLRVVQTLTLPKEPALDVPQLMFAQGGRVLIAATTPLRGESHDASKLVLWDMADGSLAHQVSLPGKPTAFDLTPNERHLVMRIHVGEEAQLLGFRLEGEPREERLDGTPPAPASQ